MALRAVCTPVPSTVSGAQPTRTPAARPASMTARASSSVAASGFSPYTALPPAIAFSATSACAAGIVRFRTRSTSGSVVSSSTVSARTPCAAATAAARAASRSATATSRTASSRSNVDRYAPEIAPTPTIPTLSGWPTGCPSR